MCPTGAREWQQSWCTQNVSEKVAHNSETPLGSIKMTHGRLSLSLSHSLFCPLGRENSKVSQSKEIVEIYQRTCHQIS